MKTIAEQLNVKEFPFEIKDKQGNLIYYEYSNGDWYKHEYDKQGNKIYFENSDGYWAKYEYNEEGNVIYCEDSRGTIMDNRIKEMTKEEAEKEFKIKIV